MRLRAKVVAPFMGAWIETKYQIRLRIHHYRSRPSWARGLKQLLARGGLDGSDVAPFMGAWIETSGRGESPTRPICRALHGRVD